MLEIIYNNMAQYDELLKNTEEGKEKLEKISGINISELILPIDDIVKNLMKYENEFLTDDDVNLMVDGFSDNSPILKDLENIKQEGDTPYKQKLISNSINKIKEDIEKAGILPLAKDNFYFKKAKDLASELVEKIMNFLRKVKELLQELVYAVVNLVSAIPGGILMLMPFAFNVPGMISLIMTVLTSISSLKSKCADVLENYKFFDKLEIIFSRPSLNIISYIINTLHTVLVDIICGTLIKSTEFIDEAFNKIREIISKDGDNAKKICKRLKKLKYIYKKKDKWLIDVNYNKEKPDSIDPDDADEIESILETWEVFDVEACGNCGIRCDSTGIRRKEDMNEILNKIDEFSSEVENLNEKIPSDKSKFDLILQNENDYQEYVYDISLPNGEKIIGLTEEELQFYLDKYNVIYSDNTKYTYSIDYEPLIKI
jgi:hypothetical protein